MGGIVWFRRDLRLGDNPAWAAATSEQDRVTPLFVIDPRLWTTSGVHRRRQLAAHLEALDAKLEADHGGRLMVVRGDPVELVPQLAEATETVYWNDDYTPYAVARDEAVAEALPGSAERYAGSSVHPPGSFETGSGTPYKVFTPYSRRWFEAPWAEWPEGGDSAVSDDPGDGLPTVDGDPLMEGGEDAALDRLREFLDRVDQYGAERDRPDLDTTSRLSADLKFGTVAPRRVVSEVGRGSKGREEFVRQLAWRDFYAQILFHHPDTVDAPLRPEYSSIRWRRDDEGFEAWREGQTGYPIVDAGMRQLNTEGWMHNRVRMITASFLVKDLLIDWRRGERHFRQVLVDADLAQNVGNWQWVAGTGADAAPYFRIFNPLTQSEKFDPSGEYIRRYVPELEKLEGRAIHVPWEADAGTLEAAGIELGTTYPKPIVEHAAARQRTLEAYEAARSRS